MDYSPQIVDRWVKDYQTLITLAESPSSSAHLLSSECRHSDKACGDGRPVGIKSTRSHSDPMRYVDVLSDISHAAYHLHPSSLERRVVLERMATGAPMAEIRARLGVDTKRMWAAYRAAVKAMALDLGWVDESASEC